MAPAGSYLDKGIGKLCQKGTYSIALNSDATCTPCPIGITTAGEGSDSAADCNLAMKGYFLNNGAAELCPVDTYQDQEAAVSSCTPCPNGERVCSWYFAVQAGACNRSSKLVLVLLELSPPVSTSPMLLTSIQCC